MDSEEEEWCKPVGLEGVANSTTWTSTAHHASVILHIDMDCFYAQVEMLRNPELRNKPLGIQQKYIIVTCNYVARERGLTKLMTVKDAREKCPDLILVCGEDLENYRQMSYKISNYLQNYCPLVERLGFDENFLDITDLVRDRMKSQSVTCPTVVDGHVYLSESSIQGACSCGCHQRLIVGSHIAAEIRAGVLKELGITCCAGIAHNKLLSKLVAGTHKPNQQTTIFPGHVECLMSQLTSVRSIQGIGHATENRLKELGIVSIPDLQNADVSILQEEFGRMSAESMKKLCMGVDDTKVVAFGLPQTLSDEDSFKKCSDAVDVKSKIKQLVTSLLYRLLEDGRQPHTLRLSIRRLTETNRYNNNRETRQCTIQPMMFNRFSIDNLDPTCSHLEDLAYLLFMKMVDITQTFHLTLINVAFAKLEQKSSVDISNFFSPQKGTESRHMKPTGEVDPTPECNVLQHSTDFKNNNEVINNGFTANSKFLLSNDKSRSMKLTGMQKWLSKNTSISDDFKGSDNESGDIRECKEHVASIQDEESKPLKRALSTGSTTQEEQKTKRKREQFDMSSNVVNLLPPDLDISVFLELPTHIQKDILADAANYSQNRTTMTDRRGHKHFIPSNTSVAASTISSHVSMPLQFTHGTVVAGTSDSSVAHKQPGIGHHTSNKFNLNKFNFQLQQQNDKSASPSKPNKFNSQLQQQNDKPASPSDPNLLESTDSDTLIFPGVIDQLGSSNSESLVVPDGIDKSVFSALPADIKKDLITQWKLEGQEPKQRHAGKANKPLSDKPYFKMPKPSPSTNITSYFSKKT